MSRSRCICVNLEWLILRQIRMTSIFLGVKVSQTAMHGFISFNLFSVHPSHSLCHLFLMKEETAAFKSK